MNRHPRHTLRFPLAYELYRMVRSPWFITPVALLVALVVISAALDHLNYREWHGYALRFANKNYGMGNRVMVNSWVGTDSKPSSVLLYFLLPLFCLLPGAGSLIEDRSSGYIAHALSRIPDSTYYLAKAIACGISAGLMALIPLAFGIVAAAMAAPYGLPDIMAYITFSETTSYLSPFQELFYARPTLYLLVWCAVTSCLCGLWACAVLAASLYVRNAARLYVGAFIFQILLNYVTSSLGILLLQDVPNTVDMFTLVMPAGYANSIPTVENLLIMSGIYLGASVILPVLSFQRRCYP